MSIKIKTCELSFQPAVHVSIYIGIDPVLWIPWIGARKQRSIDVLVVQLERYTRRARAGQVVNRNISSHPAANNSGPHILKQETSVRKPIGIFPTQCRGAPAIKVDDLCRGPSLG